MMNEPVVQDSIFQFVSVRAPQEADHQLSDVRYPRYPNTESLPLVEEIGALQHQPGARKEAIEIARTFLESKNNVHRNPEHKDRVARMVIVERELDQLHPAKFTAEKARAAIQAALGQKISDFLTSEMFQDFEKGLWEAFYAYSVVPNENPTQREAVLGLIRTSRFLKSLSSLGKGEDLPFSLSEYQTARPRIPRALFPEDRVNENVQTWTKQQQTDQTAVPEPLDTASDLSDHTGVKALQAVDEAIADLRNLARLRLGEAWEIANRAQNKETGVDSEEGQNFFRAEGGNLAPWRLDEESLAKLQDKTVRLIRSNGFNPLFESIPDLIANLEQEKRMATERLLPGIRSGHTVRIGNVLISAGGPQAATGLASTYTPPPPAPMAPQSAQPPIPQRVPPQPHPALLAGTRVRTLGVGDLMVVKQTLLRYERGEIAHVENVLLSEERGREHRRLRRTEEIITQETETQEESERDLQSTERFELQKETQTTIESDMSIEAGISVTASYGPVSTTAYGDFAYNQSRSESNRNATRYATDVVERSLSRIKERVRQERVRKTLEEFEEINTHRFNNMEGAGNISGIYRWLDKIYHAQVVNYGQRLMLEFIVPEPAAFYIFAEKEKARLQASPQPPPEPVVLESQPSGYMITPLTNHGQLTEANFLLPVGLYNVSGVTPPPPFTRVLGSALHKAKAQDEPPLIAQSHKELEIPEGYVAKWAWIRGDATARTAVNPEFLVKVGLHRSRTKTALAIRMNNEEGILPISVLALNFQAYTANIEVYCERTPRHYEDWQLKTFNAIMDAYRNEKAQYNEEVAAAAIRQGVQIQGRNPARNREIERMELKKACLDLLTADDFLQFNARQAAGTTPFPGYPEIDIMESIQEGRIIQFLEQAFEWHNLTYLFYPYFWGRKEHWIETLALEDTDPLFTSFLQAGAARVQIPVRPAYTEAILHYLSTYPAQIWNGGSAPVLDDPLFISIADSIREQTGGQQDGIPVGDPWQVRVPTSLVTLQDDSQLPDWTDQVLGAAAGGNGDG